MQTPQRVLWNLGCQQFFWVPHFLNIQDLDIFMRTSWWMSLNLVGHWFFMVPNLINIWIKRSACKHYSRRKFCYGKNFTYGTTACGHHGGYHEIKVGEFLWTSLKFSHHHNWYNIPNVIFWDWVKIYNMTNVLSKL